MPRQRPSFWKTAFLTVLALYLAALVVLPIAISVVIRGSDSFSPAVARFVFVAESIHTYLMTVFAAAWVFFLGGVFASFLNVVATRIPRGESILGSSRCPHCRTRLSFKDNIPFWGWLKNGGRCATCRLPIARRYVLVESALGLIFLFVVFLELTTGGGTLPVRPPDRMREIIHMLFEPASSLLIIVIYHMILILGMFLFALIDHENDRLPRSIFWSVTASVLVFPLIFPDAWLVSWDFPWVTGELPLSRLQILTGMMLGGVIGWSIGRLLDLVRGGVRDGHTPNQLAAGAAVTGIALGWQSILVIAIVFGAIELLLPCGSREKDGDSQGPWISRLTPYAILLLTMLFHLCTWRWFNLLG